MIKKTKKNEKVKSTKLKSEKPQKPKQQKAAPTGAKVGKGNPPEHTRFAKGTSGNLKGRPKGSKNLSTIIMDAAKAQVTATIDGKRRKISKLVASAMQLATKAAGGDPKAKIEDSKRTVLVAVPTPPRTRARPRVRVLRSPLVAPRAT